MYVYMYTYMYDLYISQTRLQCMCVYSMYVPISQKTISVHRTPEHSDSP